MKKKFGFLWVALLLVAVFSATSTASTINFNDYNNKTGQNQYLPQGTTGTFSISNSGFELGLYGDIWLNFDIASTITSETILKLDVRNFVDSELLGIQFLDSYSNPIQESDQAFIFAGTESGIINYGNTDFQVIGTDWTTFEINLGEYFTGDFAGIVFFSDNDNNTGSGEGIFRNVEFNPTPEPATMLLFGFGLLGLAGASRRKK